MPDRIVVIGDTAWHVAEEVAAVIEAEAANRTIEAIGRGEAAIRKDERARIRAAVEALESAVLTLEFGEQIAYPRLIDRVTVLAILGEANDAK